MENNINYQFAGTDFFILHLYVAHFIAIRKINKNSELVQISKTLLRW
jgi:hypothetical protein